MTATGYELVGGKEVHYVSVVDASGDATGLAPMIGIDGAETFTLNAGGRLLTFCFPGNTTVGVLHDTEPSNGLRDKITLIARELARMLG
jgi:hypothetical protein